MSYELLLKKKRTVPIKVPLPVYDWLEHIADEEEKTVPSLILGWIMDAYDNRKEGIVVSNSASAPGPVGPAGRKAEDKNFDERKAESGRGMEVVNEEAILQKVGHFPKAITKNGLIRFFTSRGYDEKRAKQIIGLLVVNGTYIEKGKWLYLAKTKKEEVVVNEGN